MSKINRRAALGAAGAVAAAGVLSTVGVALPAPRRAISPSPELLAWRKARAAYWLATEREEEFTVRWLRAHPAGDFPNEEARWDALIQESQRQSLYQTAMEPEDALDATVAVIMARPIRSWHDIAELAEMVRGEMRWNPGERGPDDDYGAQAFPEVSALLVAIEAMAGGADV